jgi:crotonobetainyl-CoA:carnitine CoA-transferase CaiB-like acyl-CoA transferase
VSGPLSGTRIIDLTAMLSGPWATMILGDQGADVIKVEPPGRGDHTRALGNRRGGLPANFVNINRSKRSVTIDLKKPEGRDLLLRLARTADVVVQNFRPGVVERLGIAEPDLRAHNPKLVYVSISGFGESGPYAAKPAYDPVIQALTGLTTVQAGSDAARPRLIRTVLPDKLTGITAAQAITAALLARERTGTGQHVRLSMLDAVLSFLWASDMGAQTWLDDPPDNQRAASFIDLIYETADGHMTVAVMTDKEWAGLARAVGKPELIDDARFRTPELRDRNVDERLALTQELLRARTTAEWLDVLEREGVPCAPALTRSEVVGHPQVAASETLFESVHPAAGRLRQTRPPARFAATPAGVRRGAPLLGEHTDEVLAELGLSGPEIARLRAAGVIGAETATTAVDSAAGGS